MYTLIPTVYRVLLNNAFRELIIGFIRKKACKAASVELVSRVNGGRHMRHVPAGLSQP